nr:DNA polymerase [Mycobacterium kiyosense]
MSSMSNGFDVRGRELRAGELAAWLSEHSLGNRFGLDVLGSTPNHDSEAVALAIVAADGEGRYIEVSTLTPDDEAALSSWLADLGPPKAVHDVKAAMHALAGRGWTLRGVTSDTMLAAHLLHPERRGPALNDLLMRHMRCALPAAAAEPDRSDAGPPEALILRTCAVLDLADVLDEELARIDSSALLGRVALPVQRVLAGMERTGIAVDHASLARGAAAMPPNSVAPDGRIHATFDQTGTVTGAVTSTDPDLRAVTREALVPGPGYAELMSAGYRELESRIIGQLSGGADDQADQAREAGYAATLLGRRRYLPDLNSRDPAARQAAERDALAMVVQGSAADIVNTAMVDIDEALTAMGLSSRLLLQVDQTLVFEVADGERDALTEHVRECLAGSYSFDAPLDVSIGCGLTWAAADSGRLAR